MGGVSFHPGANRALVEVRLPTERLRRLLHLHTFWSYLMCGPFFANGRICAASRAGSECSPVIAHARPYASV